MRHWSDKYYLTNGLIVSSESYWKNELRSRIEYEYDRFGNIEREIETYNINEGDINKVSKINMEYQNELLLSKKFDFGLVENYSDFDEFGNPRLIERSNQLEMWPYKEILEYDANGNTTKSIEFSSYSDSNDSIINEKATTYFKYDECNNTVEIRRDFDPKQEFPIIMTGGPAKYEFEYFDYTYNKKGLWTKKYKTVNSRRYLIAKRRYK